MLREKSIAVVIPCYKVRDHITGVLDEIGDDVDKIFCVDDFCPEKSYEPVLKCAETDPRIVLIRRYENGGVGAATIDGFRAALGQGYDVIVKIDGDGQMDPKDIHALVHPIVNGSADYVKGNRFYFLESLKQMPWIRIFGNSMLSFLGKISSGYWNMFDITNGFIAIHKTALSYLPLSGLRKGYFFESDILFRLNTIRAVVVDVPIHARYQDEASGINIYKVMLFFPYYHLISFLKRFFYNYILRDFSIGTIYFLLGIFMLVLGGAFGIEIVSKNHIGKSIQYATPGQVMLSALPIILGVQFLIGFFLFDMQSVPTKPLQKK